MEESPGVLKCPRCSFEHEPYFRYCIKCGAKLPTAAGSKIPKNVQASGVSRGVEPSPDALYAEPRYTGGHGGEAAEPPTVIEQILPIYHGAADERAAGKDREEDKAKAVVPPSPWLLGFLVIFSVVLPPIGIVCCLVMVFSRQYRHAALPMLLASLLGGSLWGWGFWAGTRETMYDRPCKTLEQYIEAQDRAKSDSGHYMPMLELRMKGYLPPIFPEEGFIEFSLVEHVLGPSGYRVEAAPAPEESRIYRMESLWTDQTGIIRLGSADGPRYGK